MVRLLLIRQWCVESRPVRAIGEKGTTIMPGTGGRFTQKEDREAEHIKESEEKAGRSEKDAERIGYATVNKQKSQKKKDKK